MDGPNLIPVAQISPSPFNPRTQGFTPADLADLTASVKEKGILFPVTVRLHPTKPLFDKDNEDLPVPYELVDGERRFRAAMFAGLAEVPAHVVDMTDEQVRDAQLISFDQKADLLPSERAAAYQREIDAGRTADELAAKVGRSVSFVRNVLRTARLSEDFLAHVDAGRVPRATAELVARVPGEKARKTVELCVLQDTWPSGVSAKGKPAEEPKTYRETKRLIESEFMVELKGCPWGMNDHALLPRAGTCESCPNRAGNAGEEYKEVRADMCLDPGCYREKLAAFRKREEAEAKQGGRKVLSKSEAEKVFDRYQERVAYDSPYQDLSATCHDDKKKRTHSEILKASPVHTEVVIAYHPKTGDRFVLADKAAVKKALAAAGVKVSSYSSSGYGSGSSNGRATGPKTDAQKKKEARRRLESKIDRQTTAATLADLASSAESLFKLLFAANSLSGPTSKAAQVLRALVQDRIGRTQSTTAEDVCSARGLKPTTAEGNRKAIGKLADDMDAAQLLGLLVELIGHNEVSGYLGRGTAGLLKLLAVDKKAIEQRVRDQVKAAAAAKKAPAGKAAAKPSANGAPKLTEVMKGEPIDGLGVSAQDLEAAKIVGRVESPAPKKPVKVKPAQVNGRPHVCIGSISGSEGQAWFVRPLWDGKAFADRHPGIVTGTGRDITSKDGYLGVTVVVQVPHKGAVEFYVGSQGEERKLMKPAAPEAQPAGPAKKKAGNRQPVGV